MYCIIVGDIVNSRGLEDEARRKVSKAACDLFDTINTTYAGSLMTAFGMVRGDAFEGVLLTQYQSPQIVQDIIKGFYAAEKTAVRISVVLGQLTVTGEDRNLADGPAFHQAFDDLEKMKTEKSTHWLQVSFNIGTLAQKLVDGHLALLKALTEGWTEKQREIVWAMEACGESPKLVGQQLGISPSLVSKQLKAANYISYRKAWNGLTDFLVQMDEYTAGEKPITEQSYVPYFSLAMRKIEQSNYKEALSLLRKSLELAKAELGDNSPLLISIYNLMAKTLVSLKEYSKSEEAIEDSLRLQNTLPKARQQYIETLFIQSELKKCQKQYAVAERILQQVLNTQLMMITAHLDNRYIAEAQKRIAEIQSKAMK